MKFADMRYWPYWIKWWILGWFGVKPGPLPPMNHAKMRQLKRDLERTILGDHK